MAGTGGQYAHHVAPIEDLLDQITNTVAVVQVGSSWTGCSVKSAPSRPLDREVERLWLTAVQRVGARWFLAFPPRLCSSARCSPFYARHKFVSTASLLLRKTAGAGARRGAPTSAW